MDEYAKYGPVHYKKYTPSGKTASRATMQLDQANKNVKAEIKQVSDVAITTDHWTDPIGHKVQADWIAKEIESERSTNNKLHSECIKIEALSSIIQMECFKDFMKRNPDLTHEVICSKMDDLQID